MDFFAPGKLLLSGEYAVLRGAKALAVPTRLGQKLRLENSTSLPCGLRWRALDVHGAEWLRADFDEELNPLYSSDEAAAQSLSALLRSAWGNRLKPQFPLLAVSRLEFERHWGLGSSSTLVSLISQWSGSPALPLFFAQLSGSGYDVACAEARCPILYRLCAESEARWSETALPRFLGESLLVYRGQKQDSAREVERFMQLKASDSQLKEISRLSEKLPHLENVQQLANWMQEHERVTAPLVGRRPVKEELFADYPGAVKSLGAWGGDFVWATPHPTAIHYFRQKGYPTVLRFDELVSI